MKKNHYINNREFHELLVEYEKTKSRKIYNKIGKVFLLLATNFMNKPKYINRTEDRKDEMISDAVYCMTKYMKNYRTNVGEYPNPFAYFTQFAKNAFLQHMQKCNKKKEMFISLDLTQNLDYLNSTTMMIEGDDF